MDFSWFSDPISPWNANQNFPWFADPEPLSNSPCNAALDSPRVAVPTGSGLEDRLSVVADPVFLLDSPSDSDPVFC